MVPNVRHDHSLFSDHKSDLCKKRNRLESCIETTSFYKKLFPDLSSFGGFGTIVFQVLQYLSKITITSH